jgi:hypothetical protein
MSINYDVNPENGGDGSDGSDGSGDSASNINDKGALVLTPSNQSEINSNITEGQGAPS